MAMGKSIKMYLTIFVATTCIYMVLYQYHISRQPLPNPEILKSKEVLEIMPMPNAAEKQTSQQTNDFRSKAADLVRRYNLFLWSPMSVQPRKPYTTEPQQQENQQQQQQLNDDTKKFETETTILYNETYNVTFPQKPISSLSPSASSSLTLTPISPSSSSSSSSSKTTIFQALVVNDSKSTKYLIDTSNNQQQHHYHHHSNKQRSAMQQEALNDSSSNNNYNNGSSNSTNNNTTTPTASSTATTTTRKTTTTTTRLSTTRNVKAKTKIAAIDRTTKLSTNSVHTTSNNQTIAIVGPTATTNFEKSRTHSKSIKFRAEQSPPPLYIITPTYRRAEQLAELTRLGYTLKHITNLLWLVIEDANKTSPLVTKTLNRIGVPYEYLVAPMPEEYKKTKKAKPRGVSNRNRGLQWLRKNATEGVFYFADDDNTYDISIFEQMRYTRKVSMWPVGLVTKFGVSSPIIRNGKIDGFYDGWIGGRKYAVDMAGFAVSVKFLHQRPAAKMPFKPGYEEDGFLKSLAPLNHSEIELLASNCTEILTWHTQTKKNLPAERLNMTKYGNTNLVSIDKVLVRP